MSEEPVLEKGTTYSDKAIVEVAGLRRLRQTLQHLILQGGPLIALILLATYLSLASPYFFTVSNLVNVSRQSSITAILAVGQTFVILAAGIDLSVGAMAALSASVSAVLMTQQLEVAGLTIGPVNFWVGVVIALLVALIFNYSQPMLLFLAVCYCISGPLARIYAMARRRKPVEDMKLADSVQHH